MFQNKILKKENAEKLQKKDAEIILKKYTP